MSLISRKRVAMLIVLASVVVGLSVLIHWLMGGALRLPSVLFQMKGTVPTITADLYIYNISDDAFQQVIVDIPRDEMPSDQVNSLIQSGCERLKMSCPEFFVFFEPTCITLVPKTPILDPDEPVFSTGSIEEEIILDRSIRKTLAVLAQKSASFDFKRGQIQIAFQTPDTGSGERVWRHIRAAHCH